MIPIILCLLTIYIATINCIYFFKKKFEEILVFLFMSLILILFIFYNFNLLYFGTYILIILIFGTFIWTIIKVVKNREFKLISKLLLTPGFFIFNFTLILIIFITRHNIIQLWDELRLWGAYPKILYLDGSLQLGNEVLLYSKMQNYFPGMSLFQYFCSFISGTFSEPNLFLYLNMFGLSFLIPATKRLNFKKAYLIPVLSLSYFILPLVFFNSGFSDSYYYKTLFVDPIIGILLGYIIYCIIDNPLKDNFSIICFSLSLAILILIKESGIINVFILIVAFIYYEWKIQKKDLRMILKQVFLISIASVVVIVLWKTNLMLHDVASNLSSTSIDIEALFTTGFLFDFVKILWSKPLVISSLSSIPSIFSFVSFIVFFIILSFIFYKYIKCKEMKFILVLPFIIDFVFVISLIVLYSQVDDLKKQDFSSIERFLCTVLVMHVTLFNFLILYAYEKKSKNIVFTFYLILLICPLHLPLAHPFAKEVSVDSVNRVQTFVSYFKPFDTQKKVYVLIDNQGKSSLLHHQLYYHLLTYNVKVGNYLGDTSPVKNVQLTEDTKNVLQKEFSNKIINEGYEFIYICNIPNGFKDQYSELFEYGQIGIIANQLYKINVNEDRISLIGLN